MRKPVFGLVLFLWVSTVNAALLERLGGLAYYDTEADLTWLADASASGLMNWADANAWAAGLNVGGVDGWRLPSALNADGSGPCARYNCTRSEMGNLFYNVLGGSAGSSITTTHNANYYLFSNVMYADYWSAEEYAPDTDYAWYFGMLNGYQSYSYKLSKPYAWAVQSGDVSAVPVAPAVWFFSSGLIGLIGIAIRK